MDNSLSDEDVQQIMDAVFAGRKILAIKFYRQATKSSLLDAKNFIEALQVRLWQESPERFSAPPDKAGCARASAVLVSVAVAIYALSRWLV
jgi:ribosomal protein L7/L12